MEKQRKQFIVKLEKEKGDSFIEYLEKNGYKNVHKLNYGCLRHKYLIIDEDKFFATNITCLAAAASSGIIPISQQEFKQKKEKNINNEKI